ncbi:hypothetical protein GGU11DRAFT_780464 [Lentinula aff. detonsa]|nr:hypothetical protein GGU11DRAFT_780464 [Lentinula aff. detonsa]
MMVFSRSVLTTFLVVGTSSSVLALPFQSFSGTGLSQNDVASTATTQAMPTIPTGYVQGQSVGVQEDAVKVELVTSNSSAIFDTNFIVEPRWCKQFTVPFWTCSSHFEGCSCFGRGTDG